MSQRPGKANRPKKSLRDSALLTCPIGRLVTAGQQLFYFGALADEVVFDKSLSRVIFHFYAVLGQPWSSQCQQETSLCRRSRWPQCLVDETEWSHPISDLWSVMIKTLFRRKSTWDLSQIWIKRGPLRYNMIIIITDLKTVQFELWKGDSEKIYNTFEMYQGDA